MARPSAAPPVMRGSPHRVSAVLAAMLFAAVTCWFDPIPAIGQQLPLDYVGIPKPSDKASRYDDPNAQMLVTADEIQYDYSNERVSAIGNVRIYYGGSTLEADKVIYNQQTKRLRAEGNARLTEADGKVIYGDILDLSDQYRDGFVDSLRLDAPDKTRFAAPRAERTSGGATVLQSGVYTACEPCKDDPSVPPKWQVKAARIIHDEAEKMIYFENARLEFFGIPMFWAPYMSAPDPTVKRKTGFLVPTAGYSDVMGVTVSTPYFWALAPNYDLTLIPTFSSRQGALMQAEWRQRTETGAFSLRAAGISQLDPSYLSDKFGPSYPGATTFRGSIDGTGQFRLNDKWVWGFDTLIMSDKFFFQDYNLYHNYLSNYNTFKNQITEGGTNQLYLTGQGDRSYFDARVMYFYGLSAADTQSQIPIIRPVIDYAYIFGQPILGGELSFKTNLTSLSRETAEFDAISLNSLNNGACLPTNADPATKTPANCVLFGVPGNYTRFSTEATWKRTVIDPLGEMFTPFVILRGDVAAASITSEAGVSNFINTGEQEMARVMPAVGMEYRYPFINVQSWGTQTVQPIAQVIFRPNETYIGKMPNEDAQSLVFDDSNLFRVNKYSGWDRVEGGSRANVGVEYTAQFNGAGTVNALLGQSYQLFGLNSFTNGGTTNTGLESGLDQTVSDYVARVTYQPDRIYTFSARFRFADQTWAVERSEVEGKVNLDRWSAALTYGDYAAQPLLGFLARRDGLLATGTFKITPNWSVLGSTRYDVREAQIDQLRVGLGYIDDCIALGVNYITDYSYSGTAPPVLNHTVMLQLSLRTLGTNSVSTGVGGTSGFGSASSGLKL
jgi:LPS-assembly protein